MQPRGSALKNPPVFITIRGQITAAINNSPLCALTQILL
ncbi:hypothetical protein BN137_588 [Cronobacter condimenti 1330]|uniref:Uncharacterized protein n=1 Tax=Cronobacter condimenti 1330 TaxID=1073999 RepID=K7ZY02_9ENTR|nr:hypothetical protein BN137_588 [Cronobacter condimenti 1330]